MENDVRGEESQEHVGMRREKISRVREFVTEV